MNTKSLAWGEDVENEKGRYMGQWVGALSIVVLNDGKVPIFVRGVIYRCDLLH